MTTAQLAVDQNEIIRTLQAMMAPDQVTELRAIDAVTSTWQSPHVVSGYFEYAHIPDLAKAVASITAPAIYFIPNPVNPALLARAANRVRGIKKEPTTTDSDIIARRHAMIDTDPVRPSGISATDEEHAAALARAAEIKRYLDAAGWPEPIQADSGNGAHLVYRVDLPADDGGLLQRILAFLSFRFDDATVIVDQTTYNPARPWKLYGTVARKGDNTPDRPHRLAHLLHLPDTLRPVPKELLEAVAAMLPEEPKPEHAASTFDLDAWMATHLPDARGPEQWSNHGRRWILPVCAWNKAHTNGAAYVVQFTTGGIGAGCWHNGCHGKKWHDLRNALEPGWQDRRNGNGNHEAPHSGNGHNASASQATMGGTSTPAGRSRSEWSAKDLLSVTFPPRRELIPGYIPKAGVASLNGRPKEGKTWLAEQFGIAVAIGGKALGLDVAQGNVLYLALEDSPRRLQERLKMLMCPSDIPLTFLLDFPALNSDAGLSELQTRIVRDGLALVVVDTLSRAFGKNRLDWDNQGEVTNALGPLQRMALACDMAILFIDHTRKPGPFGSDFLDDVLGSTAKTGVCDTILGLSRKRGERQATLRATGRDIDETSVIIEFTDVGWQLVGDAATVARTQSERRIVEVVKKLVDVDAATVAKELDIARQSAADILDKLVQRGTLEEHTEKTRGRPKILYSYANPAKAAKGA